MSLPPGFLEELRTRVSLADVVGRHVMWDARKSQTGKGEYWAPCPFHQEKTPSFKVDDRQGYYYCFGCQAKGDMISYIRETENLGFMEAVELLATEAGMAMPARDPQAKHKADRATQLVEVLELATRWFRLQLGTGAAAEARAYLSRRGLDATTLERFEIGYAPDSYTALQEALNAKGVSPDLIAAAGLSKSRDGGRPYDVFRGRIMFPIRDGRGRAVAFGGRALNPDVPAKYLNSPETELFHKSHTLYHLAPARSAAAKGQPLIVAEGYMDVIALVQAGFEATVASLGTAVTDSHLAMLWKMADEPVMALDGDTAGLRAARKVVDTALPLLKAGKSLRFALLPQGQDPDDLLRSGGGPEAMAGLIKEAQPLLEMLWGRALEGRDLTTPERRAALDADLRQTIRTIADPSIRGHYAEALREKRAALFGFGHYNQPQYARPQNANRAPWTPGQPGQPGRKRAGGGFREMPAAPPTPRTVALSQRGAKGTDLLLEATILALLTRHPALIPEQITALETLAWSSPLHSTLAQQLAALPENLSPKGCFDRLCAEIATQDLETFFAQGHIRIIPALKAGATEADARPCISDALTKLEARRGHAREMSEAVEDLRMSETSPEAEAPEETLTWRIAKATASRAAAYVVRSDDRPTGEEDAAEMSDYLQSLLDNRVWEKKKT